MSTPARCHRRVSHNAEGDQASDVNKPTQKSNSARAISIEEPDHPRSHMEDKSSDADEGSVDGAGQHRRHHLRNAGHRLAGHLPHRHRGHSPLAGSAAEPPQLQPVAENEPPHVTTQPDLAGHVAHWLFMERKRRHARRRIRRLGRTHQPPRPSADPAGWRSSEEGRSDSSDDSEGTRALNELDRILKARPSELNSMRPPSIRRTSKSIRGSFSSLRRRLPSLIHSSDTEYQDGDQLVPDCDAFLDNSNVCEIRDSKPKAEGDGKHANRSSWTDFKHEIVRLTHTLRLKGWRRVPLDKSDGIEVDRLSGALTNAVYVVTPCKDLLAPSTKSEESAPYQQHQSVSGRTPTKLLLRIYGPNVEALIDRDAELQVLRRLCRQNIGPRLLGTFRNGRFEQYLHASPLTPKDLRTPEVSKQIAKRMRELHDGIDLLQTEREAGPFVWSNWDKWVDKCGKVVEVVDNQTRRKADRGPSNAQHKKFEHVCGVNWKTFTSTVDRYRAWIDKTYGGSRGVKDQLVFAHNDTQYGNILRLEPSSKSPLLLPANEHKQLVVIDFEYANANCPGIEFSNHFTEWCYDYHHPTHSYRCETKRYPSHEEQRRFIEAYVSHAPNFPSATAATPRFNAARRSVSSFSSVDQSNAKRPGLPTGDSFSSTFSLGPPILTEEPSELSSKNKSTESTSNKHGESSSNTNADHAAYIDALIRETRLWRPANTAQWVAWGIMQAQVPGLDGSAPADDNSSAEAAQEASGDFDYIQYAHDRAMFFWGDMVQWGFVTREELPEDVRNELKLVMY